MPDNTQLGAAFVDVDETLIIKGPGGTYQLSETVADWLLEQQQKNPDFKVVLFTQDLRKTHLHIRAS